MTTRRRILPALLLASAVPLAGCAGDANIVRDIAVASGVTGGEPKPAPDFISSTRPGSADYVPVGTSAPKRVYRSKTADEVKTDEADLDRIRKANEARRGGAAQ